MIIFRYVTKEILITMLASTLVLLVIFVTNQSVQFLQRAAGGEVPATELLRLIALQVPLLVPYLLPLGLYLGVLLAFGRLYANSEMTVLAACGVSRVKLGLMALTPAFFVACLVAWLMASVVPRAQGDINQIVNQAATQISPKQMIPGRFVSLNQNAQNSPGENQQVIYAKHVKHHAVLNGVFVAYLSPEKKDQKKQTWDTIAARSAFEKEERKDHGLYLIFDKGYRYSGVPGEQNYHVLQFKQYGMLLDHHTNLSGQGDAAQSYSFSKLRKIDKEGKNPAAIAEAEAEFQWRLAMPISTLIFALLAIPLSEVRPRYGKFMQLLPAVLIYMGYADLIFLTRAWIRTGRVSPSFGMWWVHGLALLLAIALMLYRMGWRRLRAII